MELKLKDLKIKYKGLKLFGLIITTKNALANGEWSAKGIETIKEDDGEK